ncbi:MAG: T9SS type A sorting domain-containing protein [Bacteroidales bacterium]|nr:T9SS type A sorting domain-containing protein [Bacteroidales bacterium]
MKNLYLISGFFLLSSFAFSQNSLINRVVASGGDYTAGTNYRLTYTVGDLIVKKMTSANINLTTGFQQTWDLSVGIDDTEELMEVNAFPNPVTDLVRLDISSAEYREISVEILSITGTIVKTLKFEGPFNGRIVEINMSEVNPGLYLMRVSSGNGKLNRAIRLIKN